MKKRGKIRKQKVGKRDIAKDVKELNKSMIIEILVLVYFIVSVLIGITLFITLPVTVLIFAYEEFRIKRLKEKIGFDNSGETCRIIGIITAFIGFALLFSSPFFIKIITQLAIPISIITAGAFIFLISKFYDKPRVDLERLKR